MLNLDEIETAALASTEGDLKWGMETFATREAALAKMAETFDAAPSLELHSVFRDDPDMSVFTAITGNGPTSAANARFYAGARMAVLALIAEARALQRRVDHFKAVRCSGHCGSSRGAGCDAADRVAAEGERDAARWRLAEVEHERDAAIARSDEAERDHLRTCQSIALGEGRARTVATLSPGGPLEDRVVAARMRELEDETNA